MMYSYYADDYGEYYTPTNLCKKYGLTTHDLAYLNELGILKADKLRGKNGYKLYSKLKTKEIETIMFLRNLLNFNTTKLKEYVNQENKKEYLDGIIKDINNQYNKISE